MSTVLHPGRFTLLLGPPGAGKSTLLNALSDRLHKTSNVDVSLIRAANDVSCAVIIHTDIVAQAFVQHAGRGLCMHKWFLHF